MASAASALVAAESILALTPIAIKKTPINPILAIWTRTLSSSFLGYLITGDRTVGTNDMPTATALGYMNLLHISSSYESFRNLPAGQAMSILYTYPVWNMLFNATFYGEKIQTNEYLTIGAAAVGSALLNLDPGVAAPTALGRKADYSWGLFMAIIMALTESAMYVLLKGVGWRDPAKSVWVVNTSASVWLGGFMGLQTLVGSAAGTHEMLESKGTLLDTAWLTLFHGITMFSGYWLRFYAVPRLSTVTYSILSYAGLFASYLFGIFILGESPGWLSVLGALIIVGSGLILQISKKEGPKAAA
jgi:drug/metabolite transporter (DMT)-like permease